MSCKLLYQTTSTSSPPTPIHSHPIPRELQRSKSTYSGFYIELHFNGKPMLAELIVNPI